MDNIKVKNILIAVSSKETIDKLLPLIKSDKIWATEGTAKYIKLKVETVNPVALGFDFNGRLKTLSRELFARILADRGQATHMAELEKMGVEPIDLVIVDLYKPDSKNFPESMDIGGQALIRAAIKNYKSVALAFDASSIASLVDELVRNSGSVTLEFRKDQAQKAAKFIAERAKLEAELFTNNEQRA